MRKRKNIFVIATYALSFCILISYHANSHANEIRDDDYQFVLKRPDSGWMLLPEQKVSGIAPDAIAGAIKQPGFYSVVMVEHAPSFTIEEYTDTIIDGMPIEDKLVKLRKSTVFADHAAIHSSVSGKMRGIPIRYYITVVKRGEWFYQFLGWGVEQVEENNAVAFAAFVNSISFTKGKIQARSQLEDKRVTSGVGWMLDKGTFKSAPYEFGVSAPSNWRFVVGDELTTMSVDAEVGLARTNPDEYIIIIPERMIGRNKPKYSSEYFDQIAEDYSASPGISIGNISLFGKKAEVYMYRDSNNTGFEYVASIVWVGDVAYKILAWYSSHDNENALINIKAVLATIRSISGAELKHLEAKLKVGDGLQNIVGESYSLRGGVYRDYGNNILWRVPDGYWRLETGAEARNRNEDATIYIDSLSFGIYGIVICEDIGDLALSEYHSYVRENIWENEEQDKNIDTSTIEIDRHSGMLTEGAVFIDNEEYVYSLATVKYGTKAIQILFWGLAGNMKSYMSERMDALSAFELKVDEYKPAILVKNAWVDERLGFALRRPGDSWVFKNYTPDVLRSVGTIVGWNKDSASVIMLAICVLSKGQDPELIVEQMVNNLAIQMVSNRGVKLDKKPVTFKGREAVQITSTSSNRMTAILFTRHNTAYAVLAADQRGNQFGVNKINELVNIIK